MADKLDVQIVTGERVVLDEHDVDMVVAPGGAGVLGILPEHAPLVTTLASGEMRIKKGGNEQSILVFGGFMEVADNKVLILADTAERIERSTWLGPKRPGAAPRRRLPIRQTRSIWRMRKRRCAAPISASGLGKNAASVARRYPAPVTSPEQDPELALPPRTSGAVLHFSGHLSPSSKLHPAIAFPSRV